MDFNHLIERTQQAFLGKHNNVSDSEFDPDELAMGIKVEFEHTNFPSVAKSITKDHLAEIPDYYTRLAKMEYDALK